MDKMIKKHIENLWNYHCIPNATETADFILIMGSADDRVALHGAYLYHLGYSEKVITSGGYGKITKDLHKVSEGERFAKILTKYSVPEKNIIIENQASNSGENLSLVKSIFEKRKIECKTGILVTKPYMKRRAFATAMKQWPEIDWQVSAPDLSLDMYLNQTITLEMAVNLMVGDLQRIKEYALLGFQIPQNIPEHVWLSYEYLVNEGYNKYVLK